MNPLLLPLAATLLLAVISILVLLKESGQGKASLASGLLLLALVELFDGIAISDPGRFAGAMRFVLVGKSLLPAAFLLYGLRFTRRGSGASPALAVAPLLTMTAIFSALALLLPMEQFYAGLDAATGRLLVLGRIGYWFYLGLMVFCIAAMVNLESVFAGIRGTDRWRIKHEFLGVGAILAVMIFYFSQGLLYKAVNPDLLPARSGVVIVAALLIGYSRFYRGRTANLAVSRQALYRSFTLIAVGLYLLVLGLLGEGMRRFDVSITRSLAIFTAILSGIAFLALLLSEEIRRRLRVFITKHFYAQKHAYREEWLGFSQALAGCRSLSGAQEAIVERYQQLFGLRFAVLYAREGSADAFALAATRESAGKPGRVRLSVGLLRYFTETGRVLNPVDGEYAPTQEEAEFLRGAGTWLLVPLMLDERLEAFVVLGDQIIPEALTYEDFDLMKILGRQAVLSLSNFRLSEELAEAREMAAVAKVSSFVIHDLKNLAYTFSLMMENADAHIAEPDFQRDLVKSIRSAVAKVNTLIVKLKTIPGKQELKAEPADVGVLAREGAAEVRRLHPALSILEDCAPAESRVDVHEMRNVVQNLLLNACDAVGPGGRITVRTGRGNGEVFLAIEDNGQGMSPTFIESQLFRPFRTTKGKGLGIGLYQCKQIVEAHGGRIEVASREGEGSVFTVVLPENRQA